jgi:hypothetical protein
MLPWTFYPAFIGTFISVVGWIYLSRREHIAHLPRTLSELASEKPGSLIFYRAVLWICGPLFAITMFLFITPRTVNPVIIAVVSAFVIVCEILIGFFPAQRGKVTLHDVIAGVMGAAMVALGYAYAGVLNGGFAGTELMLAFVMSVLALLCFVKRKYYLFYELPLIFISHFSILVAALALRPYHF